jgi:hypothetical protein
MNERIKELVKQSGPDPVGYIGNWGRVEWVDNIYPQIGDTMYASIDLEKFAELIVRECVKSLWTEECRISDLASEEYTRGSNKIKKHFGVKE